MKEFEAVVKIRLKTTHTVNGVEGLEVNPEIPKEIAQLPAEAKIAAIEGCVRALSQMGLQIMEASGMKPENAKSVKLSK